jgi:deoxycytidylate deaminase
MYVTLSPCEMCAKAIVNSGVKTVIYKKSYRNLKGVNILSSAGIIIKQV